MALKSWSETNGEDKPSQPAATDSAPEAAIHFGERMRGDSLTGIQVTFTGDEHVLTIGPTRSGKGRRLLAPNLIMDIARSAIVIDPKGELARWTARHRQAAGHEIIYLDPFGVLGRDSEGRMRSSGFNPLPLLDPSSPEFVDDAMGIAEALVQVEGSEPHWSASAQDLVAGFIMLERVEQGIKASFRFIRQMLCADAKTLTAIVVQACKEPRHPAIPNKLSRFQYAAENKEMMSILSTAQTQTRFLDSPPIINDLERDPIDFAAMKLRPMTVYLILPPARLSTHAKWLRLVIDSAIRALQRTPRNPQRPDVLFMLDEFPQLGRMESIETSMALNAGFGIKIWAVIQHLNQLVHQYDENWETFLSGGAITTFAPRDAFTSEHLSRLSGQEWVDVAGSSVSDKGDFTSSNSKQLQASVMPHDFRRMPRGMMIAFIPTEEGQVMRRIMARDFSQLPHVARHIEAD